MGGGVVVVAARVPAQVPAPHDSCWLADAAKGIYRICQLEFRPGG